MSKCKLNHVPSFLKLSQNGSSSRSTDCPGQIHIHLKTLSQCQIQPLLLPFQTPVSLSRSFYQGQMVGINKGQGHTSYTVKLAPISSFS